jgi:conjugal transfer pilus assembly protein TraU
MVKSHYRLQIAKPRRGSDCVPVGRPSFIWGATKDPPLGTGSNAPDNFLWVMTRARSCCIGYSLK